jgi:hypothetical protein
MGWWEASSTGGKTPAVPEPPFEGDCAPSWGFSFWDSRGDWARKGVVLSRSRAERARSGMAGEPKRDM